MTPRGRRFLASMRPGPDWTPGTRLEPFVPFERPVVNPPSPEEPMRWKLALPERAHQVSAGGLHRGRTYVDTSVVILPVDDPLPDGAQQRDVDFELTSSRATGSRRDA